MTSVLANIDVQYIFWSEHSVFLSVMLSSEKLKHPSLPDDRTVFHDIVFKE